jgi:hypothetical protein
MIGVGGLLIAFRRRRGQDGEPRPFGVGGLVPAGAAIGASASNAAALPPVAMASGQPTSGSKAKRTPRTKASKAAAVAGVAAATAVPEDVVTDPAASGVVDATSWEVSDDAPLAATSAAYAATKAAVAEPTVARTFTDPPAKGVERATVRSRRVRFNAEPDDLRSAELGRLDRGDEVEIVGSFEGFLNVRIPDGTTGWIHRAALI